jgi:signal transduction histidine kinase
MLKDIAIGIIICLLLISLVVLFCTILIKLYIKKIKEHNLKKVEFQKTINKTIIETQEQVFVNISQDLHDDIGQQLTFLNFQLEKIKLDDDCLKDDLDKLTETVAHVSKAIRDLSHSMNNQLIIQNDLQKAIENEVKRIKKYKTIQVNFDYIANGKTLSDTEKIFVFRIFQETIGNCLKYAKATIIDIKIGFLPNFMMEITDNGIGFDTENTTKSNSLGLINIRKRAEMIHFSVSLTSKINQGTHLCLTKATENE